MSKLHESALRMKRLVLVVDDDSRIRQSLGSLLSSGGFEVRLYAAAADLLADAALAEAGCLITDQRMPVIDGWELQQRVATLYPHLPVIFVTAHPEERAYQRALSMGAFAFFYKPFDAEDLLRSVAAAFKAGELSNHKNSLGC